MSPRADSPKERRGGFGAATFAVIILACVCVLATSGAARSATVSRASEATLAKSEVVTRSGTTLTLDGHPFSFTGINIYMAASGGTPSSCGGELYPNVGVPLSDMPNGIVIRFWAFQNLFVSGKSFNWSQFDQVLKIAAAHGDKVIPVLANQYSYCDGTAKDLAWYESGYRTAIGAGNLVTYQDYVSTVVTRYAGNPTIAMWQLVNEGEAVNSDRSCDESAALQAMLAFSNDVGGTVHRLDPSHLVSLGTLAGYSGSGQQWCGAANADYQTLMASPGNDVCDYHDYGYPTQPMGIPFGPNLATAIRMCHAVGKPIMVAESGIYATSSADLAPRAAEFRVKLSAQFQAGVVGDLLWCWVVKPAYVAPAQDPDYGISPGDPVLGVLGTTSATSVTPLAATAVIRSVSPGVGSVAGGTSIIVVGSGFEAGATVAVGGYAARHVRVISRTKIVATAPKGRVGVVSVVVSNPDHYSVTRARAFRYVVAPSVGVSGRRALSVWLRVFGTAGQRIAIRVVQRGHVRIHTVVVTRGRAWIAKLAARTLTAGRVGVTVGSVAGGLHTLSAIVLK
jgi:mannan endo-1,4-beta-mannosidase